MIKKSSRQWLNEHHRDQYVKQAKQSGYRSRAVYKLIELNERDKLFKPGMLIVDLGAAPGGWSQYVIKQIGDKGKLIAIDLLKIEPIQGVDIIQGDFSDDAILNQIITALANKKVDWVLSDISPNLSGISSVDQARSIALAEMALDFAVTVLLPQGGFLIKVFQGEGFDDFLKSIRQKFKKVQIKKPKASRGRSSEVYILAKHPSPLC